MRYYLANNFVLKRLETPALYDIKADELYELDETAIEFLKNCAETGGCGSDDADKEFIEYCLSEGILSGTPATRPCPVAASSPEATSNVPSLRYLELQITDRCNLKCRHCYIDQPEQNELSPGTIRAILDEFESMQGLRLMITGGEPLLHRDFGAINAMLPRYGFRKILFTNGLLLDKEMLGKLNVDEIQFSVDGMEPGHDALRGQGTYKKVMQAIKVSLASGIAVSAATMVHGENLEEFALMETLFKGIGIKDWTVDVPCLAGHLKHNTLFYVPPEVAGRYLNYGFGGGLHGGGEGYACGLHLLSVLAGGTVAKCAFYKHSPLGTVGEGLRKCWARLDPVKQEALQCAEVSCPVIDACRGGCRYRASITPDTLLCLTSKGADSYSGTPCAGKQGALQQYSRDIYKCFAYGIIK